MNYFDETDNEFNNFVKEDNAEIENNIDESTTFESKHFLKTEDNTVRRSSNIKKYVFDEDVTRRKKTSKAISKVLSISAIFIAIIAITIGLTMYLVTIPGMSMDNIKSLSKNIGISINDLFNNGSVTVNDQDIYDILDYLREMGYDLKSFGFLTESVDKNESGICSDDIDDGLELYKDGDNEGKIKAAKSDFLLCYLISDNYVYGMSSYENSRKKWY